MKTLKDKTKRRNGEYKRSLYLLSERNKEQKFNIKDLTGKLFKSGMSRVLESKNGRKLIKNVAVNRDKSMTPLTLMPKGMLLSYD
tara:strand:+ start:339 stop:593 length:255 start_codon:yes stop_codon:yes gene_type:complete